MKMHNYGLNNIEILEIQNIFSKYPMVEKVVIFGSRVKGSYNDRSDIDLAIFGEGANRHTLALINMDLENLDIKYLIDLLQYNSIQNPKLKDHIDRLGATFYSKPN